MMNGVALLLILTSLVGGSFWSPTPHENDPNPNVVIREGHQSVVVEYDQQGKDGNTKVSISPHEADNSKEEETSTHKFGPRELVCDAFGKCKHKIANVLGKVGDKTKEEVLKGVDKAKEVISEGSGKLKDGIENIKESDVVKKPTRTIESIGKNTEMKEVMDEGKSKLKDVYEKAKEVDAVDTPKRVAEDVERNMSKAMGFVQRVVKGGASKLKEEGKENANRLGEMAEKVVDGAKDGGHRMKETAKRAGGSASDSLKEGAHMVREMAEKTTIKTQRSIRERLKDMLVYSGGMYSLIGLVHLLGFSMAFGMSMWVTFAASYILGDALPRQQFGMLQSRVYPVYFKVQACSIAVAFLAHLYGRKYLLNRWEVINVTNIVIAVLLSLVNLLYLEPRATQVMFQRVKLEKDAGRGRVTSRLTSGIADDAGEPVTATTERQEEVQPETQTSVLSEKLRTLNRLSSYVNVLTLMSLSLHLVYLGQRIEVN